MLFDSRLDRIVVLRALQLGDMLCAVPALRALRAAQPEAHIALIGLPWAAEFVDRFGGYLDELIEFPGYPGIPERPASLQSVRPFFDDMARRRWDLAIQLQGDGTITNGFVARLGAGRTAGFSTPDAPGRDPENSIRYPGAVPEPRRHLALMAHLGAAGSSAIDDRLEIPIHPEDRRRSAALRGSLAPGTYAVVHAGARDERRRWPAERFASVADRLADRGLRLILTGSAEERQLTEAVRAKMRHEPAVLAGRTDLGAMAALIDDAAIVVANDTGVSHLATATRTPSVIIFTASEPGRWAPTNRRVHVALTPERAPACWWDTSCDHGGRHPGTSVEVERVLAAVDRLLRATRGPIDAGSRPFAVAEPIQ